MTSTRLKKILFISTIFLLTHSSHSSASTETPTTQEIETEKVNIEDPKVQEVKTNNNKQNVDYLLELYANDKWGFMGKKFIDEWKYVNVSSDIFAFFLAFFHYLCFLGENAFILPITIGSLLYFEKEESYKVNKVAQSLIIATTIIVEILVIIFHFKALDSQLQKYIQDEQKQISLVLKDFLDQWPKYKKITPVELHSLFEKLNSEIKKIDYTDVLKIIPEIQDQIKKNDPKYYELYKKEINPTQSKTVFYPVFINH